MNQGRVRRVRVLGLLAAVLLALLLAAPAQAQDGSTRLTLADYRAVLKEARDLVARGGAKGVAAARELLAEIDTVVLENGETIAVSPVLDPADRSLSAPAAEARLGLLLTQLDASANDDLTARLAVLEGVLARSEFNQTLSPWERFWRWLTEQIDRYLPSRDPGPAATNSASLLAEVIGWTVIVAGAVAIIWLLSYWLRGLVLNMVADADARRQQTPEDLPQTPGEARRRADTLAQSGNYREAVRNLYLSALLTLEQHGLVTTDRSLTNREVLARVPTDHPIRPHLKPVVDTFDEVWYGVHEPDLGTFGSYSRAIDDLAALTAAKE